MGHNSWESIRNFIQTAKTDQKAETISGAFLGIVIGWHWLNVSVAPWLVAMIGSWIVVFKGIFVASISSLASNLVSYLFKKYTKTLTDDRPQKNRKGKDKRAA